MPNYKIYHNVDTRTINIEGISDIYPEACLRVSYLGGSSIAVRPMGLAWNVLGPVKYSKVEKEDGTGFVDVYDCIEYLKLEFLKRYETSEIDWTEGNW